MSGNEYRRPINFDDQLTSVFQISDDGAFSVVVLPRLRGEREFSPREQRLLSFFHGSSSVAGLGAARPR